MVSELLMVKILAWRRRVTKCSVPHDRKISGGRRSESVRESGNLKQVEVKAKAKVQDRRVEAAPVMMQAAESQPVKVEGGI